jgi:chromosome segregation ATPase
MYESGIMACRKCVPQEAFTDGVSTIHDKFSKFDTMPFAGIASCTYDEFDNSIDDVDFYYIIKKSIATYNRDIKLLEKGIEELQTKINELVQYDNIEEEIIQVQNKILEVNNSMASTSISDIPTFVAFKKSLEERLAALLLSKKSKKKQELVQELERKTKLLNNTHKKKDAIQQFDIEFET